MRRIGFYIGGFAGAVLWVFELIWFYRWWDLTGLVVGLVIPPLIAAFPFIHWSKQGFSILYFALLGISVIGFVVIPLACRDEFDSDF